jgi:hypothetical protein
MNRNLFRGRALLLRTNLPPSHLGTTPFLCSLNFLSQGHSSRRFYSNDTKDQFLFGGTSDDRKSFRDLGISDTLIYALRASQIDHPSVIQSAAFQPIFEGKDVVLGAETGHKY